MAEMHPAVAIRHRWPPIELVMLSSNPGSETNVPDRGILLDTPFDRRRIVTALKSFAG